MLTERRPCPVRDVRSIEAHRAGGGAEHADNVARQRGLAGAGRTDNAQHFARLDPEYHAAQDRLGTERRHECQGFNRKTAFRSRQRKTGFARRAGRQKLADAQECRPRRDKVAPGPDDLLDRLQGASEQDAGGKHGADGGKSFDDQIGAKAEDDRLHRKPQETDDALQGGGAIAGDDLALDHADAITAPPLQQAVGHAHRAHHLGVAQAHFGEAVVARSRLVGLGDRPPDDPFVDERHHDKQDRASQRKCAERRVQDEYHRDIDRRPGKIEDRMDSHAGDELAEGVEIAQQLAARAGHARRAVDNCRHDAGGDSLVEANAGARQDARAHHVKTRQGEKRHQQRNGQHHQRDLAGARDHPVIDLQHVQRAGQIKQVDAKAEYRRGDKIAAALRQEAR